MADLEIKGFIETSFLDWDGKIVSTIYVPFCNFRCPFCHNSGLIENPGHYETIPISKIENFLVERKDFIDGVCITGGEPCLHKDRGLFEFINKIKELGFKIKADTNGTDPDFVKKLIDEKMVDFIAMDIKGPLDERYDKLSGINTNLDKIKKSIELIMQSGIDYEFRTTVVPGLLNAQDIKDIAKYLKGAKKYVIQQFVAKNAWDKGLTTVLPYEKEKILEMMHTAKKYINNVVVRGI